MQKATTANTRWPSAFDGDMFIDTIFLKAARIVADGAVRYVDGDWVKTVPGRPWFERERCRYALHPAVIRLMRAYRPDDWQQLLLEWPHKSESDPNRLAYTRDERSGEADRQVITTIGKYLRRHFSQAPDDMIRDITAQYTYGGEMFITNDIAVMVNAVTVGPRSCMSGSDFLIRCEDGQRRHPYAVYDPSLGWSMAIRQEGGEVLGRCVLWQGNDPESGDETPIKIFVRSYKRERDETSHSGSDEALEAWLANQGYVRRRYWPDGTPLMRYRAQDGYLMPYIDGGTQNVDEDSFTIHGNGDLEANNTGGLTHDFDSECSHCGRRYNSDDEGIWVGRHEDEHVCGNCADEYVYVYGRNGNQYYIHADNVIEAGGEYYDQDYLDDNGIVQTADGDYAQQDDCVWIESTDEYYEHDDHRICYAEDTERYELCDDCWQCAATNKWYTDDTDSVEIGGSPYHPDDAPETETNDDTTA